MARRRNANRADGEWPAATVTGEEAEGYPFEDDEGSSSVGAFVQFFSSKHQQYCRPCTVAKLYGYCVLALLGQLYEEDDFDYPNNERSHRATRLFSPALSHPASDVPASAVSHSLAGKMSSGFIIVESFSWWIICLGLGIVIPDLTILFDILGFTMVRYFRTLRKYSTDRMISSNEHVDFPGHDHYFLHPSHRIVQKHPIFGQWPSSKANRVSRYGRPVLGCRYPHNRFVCGIAVRFVLLCF